MLSGMDPYPYLCIHARLLAKLDDTYLLLRSRKSMRRAEWTQEEIDLAVRWEERGKPWWSPLLRRDRELAEVYNRVRSPILKDYIKKQSRAESPDVFSGFSRYAL